ncbi:unnamed protein product [Amoebophrya sp. A120]|nr:unnamed protein product [Amoebophrya sp. A120]|eukprot:GSA120T00017602001.1
MRLPRREIDETESGRDERNYNPSYLCFCKPFEAEWHGGGAERTFAQRTGRGPPLPVPPMAPREHGQNNFLRRRGGGPHAGAGDERDLQAERLLFLQPPQHRMFQQAGAGNIREDRRGPVPIYWGPPHREDEEDLVPEDERAGLLRQLPALMPFLHEIHQCMDPATCLNVCGGLCCARAVCCCAGYTMPTCSYLEMCLCCWHCTGICGTYWYAIHSLTDGGLLITD